MNRSQIDRAKESVLENLANRPADLAFASLVQMTEERLGKSILEAREVVSAAATAADGSAKLESEGVSVPLLEDAEFLRFGLSRAKDMIFRDENRIDIGIGGSRVNKVSKRLFSAAEVYLPAAQLLADTAADLEARVPGASARSYDTAARAVVALCEWDAGAGADYAEAAIRSIEETGRVSLSFFVCPPVEFGYLSSDSPEQYLRTSMSGSLLSRQVERLADLITKLDRLSVPVRLNVFIGDTDERDYIFPVLGKPQLLQDELLAPRREALREAVAAYISAAVGKGDDARVRIAPRETVTVQSLSSVPFSARAEAVFEDLLASPQGSLIGARDVAIEVERMRELWAPGNYYEGIPEPKAADLERIVLRKFATYAAQGVLLAETVPQTILIQTELPPLLRTDMLNEGRVRLGWQMLPAVYLWKPEERTSERSTQVVTFEGDAQRLLQP